MDAPIAPLEWGGWIIRPTDAKCSSLGEAPNASGIYAYYTADRDLIYVGRSVSISSRLRQHRDNTLFDGPRPAYFSFREVPQRYIAGVEGAHIHTLEPAENRAGEHASTPFQAELRSVIARAWADVLPDQRERVHQLYLEFSRQIAARL